MRIAQQQAHQQQSEAKTGAYARPVWHWCSAHAGPSRAQQISWQADLNGGLQEVGGQEAQAELAGALEVEEIHRVDDLGLWFKV